MRVLLDTHIYLWCLNDDRRLSKQARNIIFDATEVYVSSASIWEAAIKIKLKKLNVQIDELITGIAKSGFFELPITSNHTRHIVNLPDIHRDPFDRLLISQAMSEPLRFLSADRLISQYSELVMLVE